MTNIEETNKTADFDAIHIKRLNGVSFSFVYSLHRVFIVRKWRDRRLELGITSEVVFLSV